MKFQDQIRSNNPTASKTSGQVSKAVQHFLPNRDQNGLSLRLQRVKDVVDESLRIAAESKKPGPDNSVSFCHHCNCDSGRNQSLTAVADNSVIPAINIAMESFTKFQEVQRQQFMTMIQKLLGSNQSILDSNLENPALKPLLCSTNTSVTSMECDSSEQSKSSMYIPDFDCTSSGAQGNHKVLSADSASSRKGNSKSRESSRKKLRTDNELNEVGERKKGAKEVVDVSSHDLNLQEPTSTFKVPDPPQRKTKKEARHKKKEESFLSNESFSDSYIDFRPVRRSLATSRKTCSVVLDRLPIETLDKTASHFDDSHSDSRGMKTSTLTSPEKVKFIEGLCSIYKDKVPEEVKNLVQRRKSFEDDLPHEKLKEKELQNLSIASIDPVATRRRSMPTRAVRLKKTQEYWKPRVLTNCAMETDGSLSVEPKLSNSLVPVKCKRNIKTMSKDTNTSSSVRKVLVAKKTTRGKSSRAKEDSKPLASQESVNHTDSKLGKNARGCPKSQVSRRQKKIRPNAATENQTLDENMLNYSEPEYDCYFS